MRLQSLLTLFLSVLVIAGCASTKKAAEHPLAGMWEYSVDTPEGVYEGLITLAEMDGNLMGTLTSDALDGTVELNNIMFDENNKLAFKFDGGQFGMLDLNVTVNGDTFDGAITVPGVGDLPVNGSKKMAADM